MSGAPAKRRFEFLSNTLGDRIDCTVCATTKSSGESLLGFMVHETRRIVESSQSSQSSQRGGQTSMSEKEKLRRSAKEERSIATLADDSLESSALSSESSQNKSSARVWFDDTSLSNDKTHPTSAQRARKLQETRGAPKPMGSGVRSGFNNFFIFSKFREARSRLYRREILQVKIRREALDQIYKMYILLHRSKLNLFLAKLRLNVLLFL